MKVLDYLKFSLVALLLISCAFNFAFSSDVDTVDSSDKVGESVVPSLTPEEEEVIKKSGENYEFQAEVSRLMDIIINSLYTQKEVFLRELISNAADALEKVRFLSVQDQAVLGDKKDLEIRISFNKDEKTITITDSGVGMSKQELINNLGTVAKSGTANFLEALSKSGDLNLIGQFGVGFYASFLVADKVTVVSKSKDDEQHVWESTADASFRIANDPRGNTLVRGTSITMHLKEDATEFLAEAKLKELVTRFSQFIPFPIYLQVEKTVDVEENAEDKEEEVADEDTTKKEKKTKVVIDWEQLNVEKAIWLRPKEEITEAEYSSFYKTISRDYADPLSYIHFNAEGEVEFKSILYIPSHAPYDMFETYMGKQAGIKMYVRRVLVADKYEDLMPKYLNFVKGVVDSDDLPLNVARESLQQQRVLRVITKKLTRKALELFKKIMTDSEKEKLAQKDAESQSEEQKADTSETKFDKFYTAFAKNLKLGCYEDEANRSKIVKLLRFYTSKSPDKPIHLNEYIARMPDGQKAIYYISGENTAALLKSPLLQAYLKNDFEVLFLTEAVDEPCVSRITESDGKKFVSVEKGDVDFEETDNDKKRFKKLTKMYEPLTKWWKSLIPGSIAKVELSKRLVSDPVAVVSSTWGQSAYMEKIMKSQTFSDNNPMLSMSQKNLEINPNHPLIVKLLDIISKDEQNEEAKSVANVLFQSASLASGFDLQNPADHAASIYKFIAKDLGVDMNSEIQEIDVGDLNEPEVDDEADDAAEGAEQGEGASERIPIPDLDENDIEGKVNEMEESMKDEL